MIYDYLLTAFKVIVGLVTAERLIYGALLGIAFYLLWIGASLMLSFQRRFNRNCVKLYNFIKKNKLNANDANSVDYKASKISSGFSHGWKKFKSSSFGKPSDFITRREALDVEVSGGVLNQGKSFMKAFIDLSTFGLFLLNLAFLGNNSNITCYLIAESMILPLIYFVVCKICYFLYTSIKQQLYKSDIECLYELVDLLDSIFAKQPQGGFAAMQAMPMIQGDDEIATDAGEEIEMIQEEPVVQEEQPVEEDAEEKPAEEEPEEKGEENIASKYDFFKRKNIDVDKLLSEVPNKSSSLPYINVDSDYVIKDDDREAVVSKSITNLENGSELLGGMMQDMSSIKTAKKQNEEIEEKPAEEIAEEKTEESENNSAQNEEKTDEIITGTEISVDANDENVETETAESVANPVAEPEPEEEVKLEIPDVEPLDVEPAVVEPVEEESVEEEPVEENITEEKKENIATIVGGFKAKSKLASGGVVIERNEPISRRERVATYEQPEEDAYDEDPEEFGRNSMYQPSYQKSTVTQLSAESDADNVLNSFRNTPGGYDAYQGYNSGMQGGMYNQTYSTPQYNQTYSGFGQTYNQPVAPNYGTPNYQGVQSQGYNSYQQPAYNNSFDANAQDYDDEVEDFEEDDIQEKPVKAKRSKEDEPRPRNLRKRESKKVMEETSEKKRGRPKKQVFDESVSIKNDKEFDLVLARAEKLMRKSEQGLSSSQAKRIEKELKMLMDAMNKYKEGV